MHLEVRLFEIEAGLMTKLMEDNSELVRSVQEQIDDTTARAIAVVDAHQ